MARAFVALFRGINVGKAKRIAMADLRGIVEGLGYHDVQTLLNSGNLVFSGKGAIGRTAAGRIERALTAQLGIRSRVTVLSAAEVAAAIDENPLTKIATEPARLLIAVLASPADRVKLAPLAQTDWAPEGFAVGGRVAYLWCANGILTSKLLSQMGRAVGDAVTTRNLATMTKIRALLAKMTKSRE